MQIKPNPPQSQLKTPRKTRKKQKSRDTLGKDYVRVRRERNHGNPISPRPLRYAVDRVKQIVETWTKSDVAVFSYLFAKRREWNVLCPSQTTIATAVGCDERTVSRALLKFERMGYVSNNYRHKQSSVYEIASIFFTRKIFYKLRKLLPVLLLWFEQNVRQLERISIKYKKYLLITSMYCCKTMYLDNGVAQDYYQLDYDPNFYKNGPDTYFFSTQNGRHHVKC